MERDRIEIARIVGCMLDNPEENGIYHTTIAYTCLNNYIESVRMEAIGWTLADVCSGLDEGNDPRKANMPDMIKRAKIDLR